MMQEWVYFLSSYTWKSRYLFQASDTIPMFNFSTINAPGRGTYVNAALGTQTGFYIVTGFTYGI